MLSLGQLVRRNQASRPQRPPSVLLIDNFLCQGVGWSWRCLVKVVITSVLVGDQDKALRFYTDTLGFVKKLDIPMGEFRWLAVVSPDAPDGVELVLEPNAH